MATTPTDPTTTHRSSVRILFRVLAVLVGIGAIGLLEGLLWLGGWGRGEDVGDPFVEFSDVNKLFVLNDSGDRYEIPTSRQEFFQPDSFAAKKDPREFRVFCLGGSTVQGRPYSIETSFTSWLELSLKAANPSRDWEVVNCGGVSYASYRLVPIVKEVLAYEPDLLIVYTGHNEFLEDRTYARVKHSPEWVKGLYARLSRTRLYGVSQQIWLRVSNDESRPRTTDHPILPAEVDALLDYQGGLADYHRDDVWHEGVVAHFEANLRRMTNIAHQAGVTLVLANPVSNLKDTPPFKATHRHDLTPSQLDRFEQLWAKAKSLDWKRIDSKVALVKEALKIDDRYADAHFLLAKCYLSLGLSVEAKEEFLRAKDEDICPLRMLEPMHDVVRRVATQSGTPLVDVRAMFEAQTDDAIPGDESLIDHVHPRIKGHQQIARTLLDELVRQHLVELQPNWTRRRDTLYREHLSGLDPSYFPKSIERLAGLKRWTQGRASRIRTDRSATGPSIETGQKRGP